MEINFLLLPDKWKDNAVRKVFDPECTDDDWTTTAYNEVFKVDDWSESRIVYNYLWISCVGVVVTIAFPNNLLI